METHMGERKRAVILLSGGLDSGVLASSMVASGWELSALSLNYGQRHRQELDAAARLAAALHIEHRVLDLSWFASLVPDSSQTDASVPVPHGHYAADTMKLTVVPNRNMVLLSIAAAHALATGANAIAIAAHAGDHTIYPDCREPFMQAFLDCVRQGNWEAERLFLHRPFVDKSKADIVTTGARVGAPMHLTYSCYEGRQTHCGRCGTCVERREAFELAGVQDPTEYQ